MAKKSRRKIADIPTYEKITDLYQYAATGDAQSEKTLRDINRKLAKRANQRIRDLRKAGFKSSPAVAVAEDFLQREFGRSLFIERSRVDIEAITKNLEAVSNFLRAQTSTAAGERKRRKTISASVQSIDVIGYLKESGAIKSEILSDEEKAEEFLHFLSSDMWTEIRKIDSDQFMEDAAEAINMGASLDDLLDAYHRYESNEIDVFEMSDEWKKI